MSGGELATIISVAVGANAGLVAAIAFLFKKFIPRIVDRYMSFVFEQFENMRKESKEEKDKYIDSVNQLTQLASNHLTEFSEAICNKMDYVMKAMTIRDELLLRLIDNISIKDGEE